MVQAFLTASLLICLNGNDCPNKYTCEVDTGGHGYCVPEIPTIPTKPEDEVAETATLMTGNEGAPCNFQIDCTEPLHCVRYSVRDYGKCQ